MQTLLNFPSYIFEDTEEMEFLELSRILPICFRKTCHLLRNRWSLFLFPLLAWACSICYLVCCSIFLPLIFHCFLAVEMVTLRNQTGQFLCVFAYIVALYYTPMAFGTKATVPNSSISLAKQTYSCFPNVYTLQVQKSLPLTLFSGSLIPILIYIHIISLLFFLLHLKGSHSFTVALNLRILVFCFLTTFQLLLLCAGCHSNVCSLNTNLFFRNSFQKDLSLYCVNINLILSLGLYPHLLGYLLTHFVVSMNILVLQTAF